MRWLTLFLLLLAGSAQAAYAPESVVTTDNSTNLAKIPTTAVSGAVLRLSPMEIFLPLTGTCAANSLEVLDNVCVNTVGGNSWKAARMFLGPNYLKVDQGVYPGSSTGFDTISPNTSRMDYSVVINAKGRGTVGFGNELGTGLAVDNSLWPTPTTSFVAIGGGGAGSPFGGGVSVGNASNVGALNLLVGTQGAGAIFFNTDTGTFAEGGWSYTQAIIAPSFPINEGTASVAPGSSTVTGAGTHWVTGNGPGILPVATSGARITFDNSATSNVILLVNSDTSLTLQTPYLSSSPNRVNAPYNIINGSFNPIGLRGGAHGRSADLFIYPTANGDNNATLRIDAGLGGSPPGPILIGSQGGNVGIHTTPVYPHSPLTVGPNTIGNESWMIAVAGIDSTASNYSFVAQNSANQAVFTVRNDGMVTVPSRFHIGTTVPAQSLLTVGTGGGDPSDVVYIGGTGTGTGTFGLAVANSAAVGNFAVRDDGAISMPRLGTTPSGGGSFVCVDGTGYLYKKATACP